LSPTKAQVELARPLRIELAHHKELNRSLATLGTALERGRLHREYGLLTANQRPQPPPCPPRQTGPAPFARCAGGTCPEEAPQ